MSILPDWRSPVDQHPPSSVILRGGPIYTSSYRQPKAEAIALRGDRVVAVGSVAEVIAAAGPAAATIDLAGQTVIPGLIDAHVHLMAFALSLDRVDLAGAGTLAQALARIRVRADRAQPGEWILGSGWDHNFWERLPNRQDLDAIAPANPVLLASRDMHSQWASSLALAQLGIDAATPDPKAGEIVRDASREPTGILRENVGGKVAGIVQPPSPERQEAALIEALRVVSSYGITSVHVPEGAETFAALQRLRASGRLSLRVLCHFWGDALGDARRLGLRTGFGDEWIRFGNLKLFLDGALGSQTGLMIEPYAGTANRGISTLPRAELASRVREATEAGIATAAHAIGDAANRIAIDVFEETADLWRPLGLRQRIEHVQLLHPDDARRLGPLGIVASMQPVHATSDWLTAERYWGKRNAYSYAWRTVLDSGAVLAFGSDCPVERINPFAGLHAAITRQTADGRPPGGWHPEQRLTALEALRAFTLGPAYASGEEHLKGSLAPGKLADLAILDRDPIAGSPNAILETRVIATIVGGRVTHGSI